MEKQKNSSAALLQKLVSDIQGAPYPGEQIDSELYRIWYEHAQGDISDSLAYLNKRDPGSRKKISTSLDKLLK